MNSTTFEPQLTSTPKQINTMNIIPNLCSTPRPAHIRWSLSKYTPRPVDSSTPNTKKLKKSVVPDLNRLIYPSTISTQHSMKIWRIFDDNKRASLSRHGNTAVLDFLRVKFPLTKHDGKSFHVDVMSTANNRAVFTVNGLYREIEQTTNGPIRTFQRTFTCTQTPSGVLIIADHIMIMNATDTQFLNMTRTTPTPTTTTSSDQASSSQTMDSQHSTGPSFDVQNQMIQKFSQQSGMNIQYSKLCLSENGWNYDKAAQKFQELQKLNTIPHDAFKKP